MATVTTLAPDRSAARARRLTGGALPARALDTVALRQLARSVKSRPDAISWLREQERILKSNPQLGGLDLRPLWARARIALPRARNGPPSVRPAKRRRGSPEMT